MLLMLRPKVRSLARFARPAWLFSGLAVAMSAAGISAQTSQVPEGLDLPDKYATQFDAIGLDPLEFSNDYISEFNPRMDERRGAYEVRAALLRELRDRQLEALKSNGDVDRLLLDKAYFDELEAEIDENQLVVCDDEMADHRRRYGDDPNLIHPNHECLSFPEYSGGY